MEGWQPGRQLAKRVLPPKAVAWIREQGLHLRPPVKSVRFGSLRRLDPVSREYGFDRGTPVDRYYIDRFLAKWGGTDGDIRGRVIEIGDDRYTRKFAGDDPLRVQQVDILDVDAGNPRATVVADLASPLDMPDGFDCVICTQTLLLIYDVRAAVESLHRLLVPGGVALVTVPGISRICRSEAERFGDQWRFTTQSLARLLGETFGSENVGVEAYGNVLSATAFLYGLAAEELRPEELDHRDPDYEVVVAARAIRR